MESELPGFYRDPKTRKYFKNDRNAPPSIQNLEMEYNQYKKKPAKTPNIINLLINREQCPVSCSQTIHNYHRVQLAEKTTDAVITEEIDSMSSFKIRDVQFIKGGENAIFGLWTINDTGYQYVIGELPQINTDGNNSRFIGLQPTNKYIQDMCRVFSNTLLYIYNDVQGHGAIDLVWKQGNELSLFEHFHTKRGPLYCCTEKFERLALGGHGKISYYNGISHMTDYPVEGNVLTIAFDETANYMISGHSNGYIYIHDVRDSNSQCFGLNVEEGKNRCLVDSHFINPNQLFLTGVSNKIYAVDLRLLCTVNYFIGHVHSVKKRPMSIANNMLCLNGADNVIRIWHLSGGTPIHEIRPANSKNEIRGWLESDADRSYLYYFEGGIKKVYEI